MSSMAMPRPRTGTIGYARGRLGEVHSSSNLTCSRALGPGISVTRSGSGRSSIGRAVRSIADIVWATGYLDMHQVMQSGYFRGESSRRRRAADPTVGPWHDHLATPRHPRFDPA